MTRRFCRLAARLWLLLWILIVACAREDEPLPPPTITPFPPDLYIGLSDSASPLASLLESSYEGLTGRSAPVFLAGNDEALLGDLQEGLIEAAIVYHLPADSEYWFTPVALDGVVLITHPTVALEELTSDQLRGILSGSINNWSDVGGPDRPVNLIGREPGSGTRSILEQRLMGNARFSRLTQIAASDEYMQQQVLDSPGAAGYAVMAGVTGKTISLDGVVATPDSVTDQSYPLTTPLYFVALAEPEAALREFLAWIQSENGQDVLGEKYGRVR